MFDQKPTIRQLEYFITVSEERHYRRAAERLQVRQPTITNQISVLEDSLNCRLLERSRAGVHLTPVGRELLPRARAVLEAMDDLQQAARPATAGPGGTYRLGIAPTLGPYFLPEVVPTLHRRYPELKLYFRERLPAQLENDLIEGMHDVIISPQPVASPALSTHTLFSEPLFLAVPLEHPLAEHADVSISALRGEKMLILEDRHQLHRQVHDLAESVGAELQNNYEGTSLDTLRQMVAMGMGVAMLPGLYVRTEIAQREEPEVKILPFREGDIHRIVSMSWRNASPNRSFYRELAELMQELARQMFSGHIRVINE